MLDFKSRGLDILGLLSLLVINKLLDFVKSLLYVSNAVPDGMFGCLGMKTIWAVVSSR